MELFRKSEEKSNIPFHPSFIHTHKYLSSSLLIFVFKNWNSGCCHGSADSERNFLFHTSIISLLSKVYFYAFLLKKAPWCMQDMSAGNKPPHVSIDKSALWQEQLEGLSPSDKDNTVS
jgi:hypothetical protein